MNEMNIFLSFLIVIAAVFVMISAGKRVVRSISVMARFLRISEYVLSFFLIAFATSLPELSVGINSAILGVPELSFGDIMGTNIVNLALILGTVAVVGGTIELKDYTHFKNNRAFEFLIVLSPLIFMIDGVLSRFDGIILLIFFAWNVFRLLDIDDKILGRKVLRPHLSPHVHTSVQTWGDFFKSFFVFVLSMVFLLGATMAIVVMAKSASIALGISEVLIGVLIVSTATSLPDLTIGIRSVRKKLGGVALGDLFGAAAINSTLTLGLVSLIHPIVLKDTKSLWIGIVFTVLVFIFVFMFLKSKSSVSRKEGFALISLYLIFIITQISAHIF